MWNYNEWICYMEWICHMRDYNKLFKSTALYYPSRSKKIKNKRRNKRRVRKK